jgi:hypothetical protein
LPEIPAQNVTEKNMSKMELKEQSYCLHICPGSNPQRDKFEIKMYFSKAIKLRRLCSKIGKLF